MNNETETTLQHVMKIMEIGQNEISFLLRDNKVVKGFSSKISSNFPDEIIEVKNVRVWNPDKNGGINENINNDPDEVCGSKKIDIKSIKEVLQSGT